MVEFVKHRPPFQLALGYFVELVFHVGGEGIIHLHIEILAKEIADDASGLRGNQPALFPGDVVTRLNDADRGRVCAGTADAFVFQLLNEAGLGVARRRLCEVLFGQYPLARSRLSPA